MPRSPRRSRFGSVSRRANGRWTAYITNPTTGARRSIGTFATENLAWEAIEEFNVARRSPGWIDPNAGMTTFGRFALDWLEHRTDIRPNTRSTYAGLLKNHLLPSFGETPLSQITPTDVRLWYGRLAPRKQSTADSAYRLLRTIMNTARHERIISETPCTLRGAGADHSPEREAPTLEQVQALTAAMPERYRVAVVLAAWGTLRISEILALQRRDIDLVAGSVSVTKQLLDLGSRTGAIVPFAPTKSEAGVRKVHLPASALVQVAHHMEHFVASEPDAFVLTGATGRPVWRKALRRHWTAARAAVGVPSLHFHDLRHFAGTVAAQAGATTRDLMARGGWSSPQMVVRYMHTSEERDAQIASEMDRLAERSRPYASISKEKDKSLDKSPGLRRAGGDRTHDPGIMSPLL